MYDCVMQEVAGLRQQVGFLTSSLHAAEQAQSSAEAAVQEKRQQSAEAKQVNRLTLCVTPPSPSPSLSADGPCQPMLSVVYTAGADLPNAKPFSCPSGCFVSVLASLLLVGSDSPFLPFGIVGCLQDTWWSFVCLACTSCLSKSAL